MAVQSGSIDLQTRGHADIVDITTRVQRLITESDLSAGIATVFCSSSTSAVTTLEYESGCVRDLQRLFDEIVSPEQAYAHNARWGDGNGHSHIRAALLKPSLTIPFQDKRLTLGTWQQIVYIDFDNRPRQRSLIVQLIGD